MTVNNDQEVSQAVKEVILGLCERCKKGFDPKDTKSLAELLKASILRENHREMWKEMEREILDYTELRRRINEEYGIDQEEG